MSRRAALLALAALCAVAVASWLTRWAWRELEQRRWQEYLSSATANGQEVLVKIDRGLTTKGVSEALGAAGVVADTGRFTEAIVRLGLDKTIKAGQYQIGPGISHHELASKIASGDVVRMRFSIIEGTRFADVLDNLAAADGVDNTLAGMDAAQAWELVAPDSEHPPEGMLYPDTYLHEHGHVDIDILRRSHSSLQELLETEWQRRDTETTLKTPYEALILASIIEKETGADGERHLVSSTFHNRLRIGMRLQSDPTVIYGLGDGFDGNLTREHLRTDSPYNTYTRAGLPPTPIAIPSVDAVVAALNPPETDYMYFVANGTGGHHFSKTLREHNNAVNRYQRK